MRKRENLIAFRTTEGSAMERVHEQAKASGEPIKDIIESWAIMFSHLTKENGEERDEDAI